MLDVDFTALAAGGPIRLVGNLPYNLSSPILFHALDHAAVVRDMHFMLQKEVVERMAAAPGSKVYGRLSVMLQAYCDVTAAVQRGAGRVPAAAEGRFGGGAAAAAARGPRRHRDRTRFAAIVRAAFGQRRKTLRNALQSVCDAAQLERAGIDPRQRAEQLAVADFVRLADQP